MTTAESSHSSFFGRLLSSIGNAFGRIFASSTVQTSDIQNPALWLGDIFAGAQTSAGVPVTPERALSLGAYWHCVRSISEDIAKLPCITYKSQERGKIEDKDHAAHRVLLREASPTHTAFSFFETLMSWALGWGNGYAEIERDRRGNPVNLWLIHPSRVVPRKLKGNHRRGITYDVHNDDGTRVTIAAPRMLHIHGLGSDGLQGYSVWRMAMQAIGLGIATETYGATFFGNGAHLTGALRHPGRLTKPALENLRESWQTVHVGVGNAHKPAILEEGMEWQKIGVEPEAAQFLSTRTYNAEEIARWFRMPASKLGVIVKTGAGGDKLTDEDVQALYVTDTLLPWMTRIEQELLRKVFVNQDEHFAKFQVVGMLRGSTKTRADYYSKLLHIGAMSANDIRAAEDLNPIPNGDHYYIPVNLVEDRFAAAGMAGGVPAPTDSDKTPRPRQPERDQTQTDRKREDSQRRREQGAPNSPRDRARALEPVLVDAFTRVKARERNLVVREVKRHRADDEAWSTWVDRVRVEHREWTERALEPLLLSACNVAGVSEIEESCAVESAVDGFVELLEELRNVEDLAAAWESRTDRREEDLAAAVLEQIEMAVAEGS